MSERQRMAKRAPRIGQMNSTASSAIGRSYATAAEPGGSLRLQRRQLQSPERAS
jgi:hypothetical protein